MKNEVKSAVDFLTNLLRTRGVVVEQLDVFNRTLETLLSNHYLNHWFPEKPFKGSGYRCIRINHKMDPLVKAAAHSSGLDMVTQSNLFPSELTMWIDPHEVSYRIGENGSIGVLWDSKISKQAQGQSDMDSVVNSNTRYSCKEQLMNALPSVSRDAMNLSQLAAFVYS